MLEGDQADPGEAEGVGGGGLPLDAAVVLGADFEEEVGLGFGTEGSLGGGLGIDRGAFMWTFSRLLTAVFDPAPGIGGVVSPAPLSLVETSIPRTGCSAT